MYTICASLVTHTLCKDIELLQVSATMMLLKSNQILLLEYSGHIKRRYSYSKKQTFRESIVELPCLVIIPKMATWTHLMLHNAGLQ